MPAAPLLHRAADVPLRPATPSTITGVLSRPGLLYRAALEGVTFSLLVGLDRMLQLGRGGVLRAQQQQQQACPPCPWAEAGAVLAAAAGVPPPYLWADARPVRAAARGVPAAAPSWGGPPPHSRAGAGRAHTPRHSLALQSPHAPMPPLQLQGGMQEEEGARCSRPRSSESWVEARATPCGYASWLMPSSCP